MNITCSAKACPVLLSASCVFYEGVNLPYTGINMNDNLQIALQKIDAKFNSLFDVNIYVTDGTLTGDRVVSMAGHPLSFNGGNVAIGNTSPLSLLHVGDRNVNNSSNPVILISRNVTSAFTSNTHAFSDSSLLELGTGLAYNSFDARVDIGGSNNIDHYAGFQHGININRTGTITNIYGLFTNTTISAGAVTNNYGVYTYNPTGAGTITNNFGLYVANLSKGSNNYGVYLDVSSGANKWNIYANGSADNYFNGSVGIGIIPSTYKLDVSGTFRTSGVNTLSNLSGVGNRMVIADASGILSTQAILTLTTTGSSGASTLISNVLNVPTYTLSGLGGVPSTRTLTINGTGYDLSADRSWSVGTVTSVDMSVPTGFAISGNPVTTSGTLALGFASGYSLPTNASQTNWNTAYNWVNSFPALVAGQYLTNNGTSLSWAAIDLSGYVPITRTLTINGTSYDLSANRTWSVGTVTSIATTGPITGGTITGSGTIGITQATTSTDGYLSSTDWNTFNNKYNLPSLTSGSVLFSNGTTIAQDNSNFFWDNTNKRLGIGTNAPAVQFHLNTATAGNNFRISGANNTSVNYTTDIDGRSFLSVNGNTSATTAAGAYFTAQGYQEAWFNVVANAANGGNKYWRFGNIGSGSVNNVFAIQKLNDAGTAITSTAFTIFSSTTNVAINSTTDAGYRLDVNGTGRFQGNLTITNNGGLTFYNLSSQFSSHYITTSNEILSATGYNSYSAWKFVGYNVSISKNLAVGSTITDYTNPANTFSVTGKSLFTGSITASAAIAQGVNMTPTLVAAANNDVLVGLDVNPTFTNGAFTGVKNYNLRLSNNIGISTTSAFSFNYIQFNALTTSQGISSLFIPNGSPTGFAYDFEFRKDDSTFAGLLIIGGNASAGSNVVNKHLIAVDNSGSRSDRLAFRVAPTNTGWSTSTDLMTLLPSGNVIIGGGNTPTDAGYRLDVNGTCRVQNDVIIYGSDQSNNAAGLTVYDSSKFQPTFRISNTGRLSLWNSQSFFQPVDANGNTAYGGANYMFYSFSTGATLGALQFRGNNITNTSGLNGVIGFQQTFAPTSGTGQFAAVNIYNTIIQSGGANGATRGVYVNPTLTAAADWRSIEWSNNSGWGLYGVGTANNYLAGNLLIGSTTSSGEKLQVTGDAKITGTMYLNSASDALFNFQNAGANKWRIGNAYVAGANYFQLYDSVNSLERIRWNNNSTATFTSDFTFVGGSNNVATFQATQPTVKIQATGASNGAALVLSPSNSGINGSIQNGTGGGLDFYVGASPSIQQTIKSTGQLQLQAYTTTSSFSGTVAGYLAFDSSGNIITTAGGAGGGSVTTVSVVSANGFAGTVANATTTPAITLTTTITGLLKGNGTAISAASAGTDYQAPITLTTTGTSGPATLIGNTLNIPQYTGGGGGTNIYNSDGTLTANRVMSAGGFTLTIEPLTTFTTAVALTRSANNLVSININNTNSGASSSAGYAVSSDASAGFGTLYKYSSTNTSAGTGTGVSDFILDNSTAGNLVLRNTASSGDIRFITNATVGMLLNSAGKVLIGTTSAGGSKVRISGLPTSSAGLSSGDIWNNGGVLNIVP